MDINASNSSLKPSFHPKQLGSSRQTRKTFVNGVLVMDEGEIIEKPAAGRVIRGGNLEVFS
jgi:N-acyl-D-aspartate/D-glutamate deacylase